jgi:hypothetical protein
MTTPTINTVIEPHPDVVDLTTSFTPKYYEPETPPAMQTPMMPDTPIKKECFACPPSAAPVKCELTPAPNIDVEKLFYGLGVTFAAGALIGVALAFAFGRREVVEYVEAM